MGTIAAYGTVQGGLAVYDAATREHVWLDAEIVANQSIISVTYNPADKLVYIGTNVDGGMGIEQPARMESELVVWDPATRQVVRRLVPVADREGVTRLLVAPDGMIWGWAEDAFFVYDPAKNQVTHTQGGVSSSRPTCAVDRTPQLRAQITSKVVRVSSTPAPSTSPDMPPSRRAAVRARISGVATTSTVLIRAHHHGI